MRGVRAAPEFRQRGQGERETDGDHRARRREKSRERGDRDTNRGTEVETGRQGLTGSCPGRFPSGRKADAALGPARTQPATPTSSNMAAAAPTAVAAFGKETPGGWGLGEEQTGMAFLDIVSWPWGAKCAP